MLAKETLHVRALGAAGTSEDEDEVKQDFFDDLYGVDVRVNKKDAFDNSRLKDVEITREMAPPILNEFFLQACPSRSGKDSKIMIVSCYAPNAVKFQGFLFALASFPSLMTRVQQQ